MMQAATSSSAFRVSHEDLCRGAPAMTTRCARSTTMIPRSDCILALENPPRCSIDLAGQEESRFSQDPSVLTLSMEVLLLT